MIFAEVPEQREDTFIQNINPLTLNPYAAGGSFGRYKMMQKTWKTTGTLAFGYSSESTQWELSNEYQYDRV